MALIKCKQCGQMISDRAIKCPKCGTPVWAAQRQEDRFASASNSPKDIVVETKSSNKTVLYVIIGILVAALGVLGYFLLKSDKNDNQTNNSSEAHVGKFDGHYEWVGTVGAYGANMKIDINNGHAMGLYHYDFQKEGVNLSLSGECKEDGTLTLEETTPAGRNSGRFVGKLVDGSFSGTFYNLMKGTTFPFSLSLETDSNPMGVSGEDYSEYQNDVEMLKNEEIFESSESSEKDGKLEYYSESTEEDKPETYKEDINNSNSIKKRNDAEWQNRIWDKVDVPPSFPGGQSALLYWLASHVKYPPDAEENGIQGRVIVGFVIERDGSVSQVQVLRGVAPSLNKEAVRVVESMPKWTPGKQDGQNVRVKFNVPVNFRLG